MRIRKGLLGSSMHTVCDKASDPQLNNHLVQPTTSHELHPITTSSNRVQQIPIIHSQPSDPSDYPPNILLSCNLKSHIKHKAKLEEAAASTEEQEESGAATRKRNNILAAAPVTQTIVFTPLSSRQEDEKIPLKKRKGLALEKTSQETPVLDKAKKVKSKTNMKCSTTSVQQNDGKQDKAGNDDSNSTNHNMNVDKKTNKRGGAIMEGSRCSRVNGRGWRCCQQTLVGYSLCEHHLGKGRLRSITNVKGRAKMPPAAAAPNNDRSTVDTTNDDQPAKKVLVSSPVLVQPARDYCKETILLDGSCYDDDEDKDEDEEGDDYSDKEMKKPQLVKKKRMKLGMVKARSLSSLLNQTNNAVVVAADDN